MRCLVILVLGAAAVGPLGAKARLQQLALEVKMLRLELCRVTLREVSAGSAAWQREKALQQQFAAAALSPEERREMQALEIAGGALDSARIEREKRTAGITQYLTSTSQAWTVISAAANQLEAEHCH